MYTDPKNKLSYTMDGNGQALVFLHGALVSKNMWKNQIAFFSEEYKVVSIDLPEHGSSKEIYINEYTVEEIANKVVETIKNLQLKNIVLCGHSLGGMVAQEIVFKYPKLVDRLILAESSYGTNTTILEKVMSYSARLMFEFISQKQLVFMTTKAHGDVNTQTKDYLKREMEKYSIEESKRIMNAALKYSSINRLHNITQNTLILVAEENKQTHKQAQIMKKLIRNSEVEFISNAKHMINLDNPALFNKAIYTFLKSTTSKLKN